MKFTITNIAFSIATLVILAAESVAAGRLELAESVASSSPVRQTVDLHAGEHVEISVRITKPSALPPNARIRVSWTLDKANDPNADPGKPLEGTQGRGASDHGIYTLPTASLSKLLHALDSDVFLVYRAPCDGRYKLTVEAEEGDVDLFEGPRWRENGDAPNITPAPRVVKWPANAAADVSVLITPIDVSATADSRIVIEAEPNDTPEQAQPVPLPGSVDGYTIHVVGGADDVEYFDNGHYGRSGDDWFQIEFKGEESRLLTACLSIPDQQVSAQIRVYWIEASEVSQGKSSPPPGKLTKIAEYQTGKNPNERAHQQQEQHRIAVNRQLNPGDVYFLRVDANAPGYELELRVTKPAPFDDPRRAIAQGLYDHIGQVDAWLTNRPRGAAVDRRIRDSGNLLGTNCMSCHTQSGVWGPAVPFEMGYRPQNVQLWRHLINTCYQSMRPTNKLIDAANNTSLAPLDLGDGPAGTRVAGHAVVSLERFKPPRRLQSKQAIRAANFVLQSGDPGGINAAGPGANVGQGVVFNYAGEIVHSAWLKTGEARYFRSLEDKARRMLKINLKYCDDLGHRVEFLGRYFPQHYLNAAEEVATREGVDNEKRKELLDAAQKLKTEIDRQISSDLARLRQIQHEDGSWGFDPGVEENGKWTVKEPKPDPSPTATSLIAFQAAGISKDDPTVERGIKALLKMQHPTGYWKIQSQTGFVGTSYALHALSRYFPTEPTAYADNQFVAKVGESLTAAIRRVRDMSTIDDARFVPDMINAARHDSPLVRYWAMIGLGSVAHRDGVTTLVSALGDRAKPVREAAHWGLRQALINDIGWSDVIAATKSEDDYTREAAIRTLVMKIDGVLPGISVEWDELTNAFNRAINEDVHPGVRAWGTRAAWQWWIWNPPVRTAINAAWSRMIARTESNALVDNAIRYQSHALFIANGHVANKSGDHQYLELKDLFAQIHEQLKSTAKTDQHTHDRIAGRLVSIASTYFGQRGGDGDGGAGQMGYITEGSGELFAAAIQHHLASAEAIDNEQRKLLHTKFTLEGAANIPDEELTEKLVDLSLNGPEQFRGLAASGISDPRLVSLIAVTEKLEPMHRQLLRGALDPPRRKDLSDPILKMFAKVHWILPETDEQREEILQFMIPEVSQWQSKESIQAIVDAAARRKVEVATDAAWYLSVGLGSAIRENPDLHFDQLLESLPDRFHNDAEAHFWLKSIPWILEFKRELPKVKVDPKQLPPIDSHEQVRTRAVQLFLTQFQKDASHENRKLAVDLANGTAMRRSPEILAGLAVLIEWEQDKAILDGAKKVLSQGRGNFLKDLSVAVNNEPDKLFAESSELPDDFTQDIEYFRDYVVPEMTRVLRGDERSCIICHGEPGRVPSMELHAPDGVGFLPVDKLLANYRILQERVDVKNVDASRLLRKPLNVQTGKEDGHQGGRRYQPTDPGYLILRRWAVSQVDIQKKYGRPARSTKQQ